MSQSASGDRAGPHRRRLRRATALAGVLTVALAWALALVLAPAAMAGAVPPSTAPRVAPAWPVAVYWAGSRLCHQQAARSPRWFGRQAPVCGRCAGLYLGAPLGALAAATAWSRRAAARARTVVALAALPTALSVVLGLAGADGQTTGRAVAAVPLGAATAWVVAAVLAGDLA